MRRTISIKKRKIFLTALSAILALFVPFSKAQEKAVFSVKFLGEFSPDPSVCSAGSSGNYFYLFGGKIYFFAWDIWLSSPDKKQIEGVCDSSFAICQSSSAYSLNSKCSFAKDENSWPLPIIVTDFKEYSGIRKYRVRMPFEAGGKFYLFYSLMNNFGPGLYDYFRVGQGLAVSDNIYGPYSKIKFEKSNFWFSDVEPSFGEAVIKSDGKIYIYGADPGALYKKGAVLAAVDENKITDKKSWLYYTEDYEDRKWTSDLPEASVVIEGAEDEFSVSYNEYLGKYTALFYSRSLNKVILKLSKNPWGPWDSIYELKSCIKEEYCTAAKEVPALSAEKGKKIIFVLEKKHIPYLYEVKFGKH